MGLDQFDRDFAPQQGFRPRLDDLPNGNYDLTIVDAEMREHQGDDILRLGLHPDGGFPFEWGIFLNNQEAVNRLGGILCTLGFDADRWTPRHGRRFSAELQKALLSLPGRRFKGTKKSRTARDGSGKVYHDLYINARLPDQQPPAPTGANSRPKASTPAATEYDRPAPVAAESEFDIPF